MKRNAAEPNGLAQSTPESLSSLITELQRENIRLQLLVSELLLRNQQLRTKQRMH